MSDLDWIDTDLDELAFDGPSWASAPIRSSRGMSAYCARHGSYPAGEWCEGCEAHQERRAIAREQYAMAGGRS